MRGKCFVAQWLEMLCRITGWSDSQFTNTVQMKTCWRCLQGERKLKFGRINRSFIQIGEGVVALLMEGVGLINLSVG